ncbi:PorV/PorQ family protein [bacterium]|nr:PorV/PorQ family protein [bacterium]
MKTISRVKKIIFDQKNVGWFLIFLGIFCFIPYTVFASSPGTTGANFLKMEVGARPVGLGGAFVAVADDVNLIYWNSAGLSGIDYSEITLMHDEQGEEIRYEFLAYAQPVKALKGGLGVSVSFLNVGNIEGYDPGGVKTEKLNFYDFAFSLAYGRRLIGNLDGGINFKVFQEKLDDDIITAYALDIGWLYPAPLKSLVLGLNIQNIGPEVKFIDEGDALPLNIKFGGAWKHKLFGNDLIAALDFNFPRDNDFFLNLGGEFWVHNSIALRIGYKSQDDLTNGLRLGLGFRVKGLNLDYAFLAKDDFDDGHKISISFRFGRNYENTQIEKSIEESFLIGKKYFLRGDLLKAHKEFKNILAVAPGHERALELLARTRVKVEEVVTLKNIKECLKKGKKYYQDGEMIRARAEFENILELFPEHRETKEYMAKMEKRFNEVIKSFFDKGVEYYSNGNYIDAKKELNKVLTLDPYYTQAKEYITFIKQKRQKIKEVKKEQRIKRVYEKGIYLYKGKHFKEALYQFKKILLTNPDYKKIALYVKQSKDGIVDRCYKKGLQLYQKEEWGKALKEFKEILTFNSQYPQANAYIAKINKQFAIVYYKEATKLYKEKRLSEAIKKFKKVVKLDPKNKLAISSLKEIQEKLTKIHNDQANKYNKQGLVEYSNGKLKQAIKAWKKALELNSDLEMARKNLKRAQAEIDQNHKE